MSESFLHYFSFILTVLFSAALALALSAYKSRGLRAFRLAAVYFGALLAVDLFARDMELKGAIYTLLSGVFSVPALPTAICYSVMVVTLSELMLMYCGCQKHTLTVVGGVFFPLWFVNLLLLKNMTSAMVWLYILPYQVFTLSLSIYGIAAAGKGKAVYTDPVVSRLLWLTAVFSVLIVIEDSLVAWYPPMEALRGNIKTTRNVAENILQIIYALTVIRLSSGALIPRRGGDTASIPSFSPGDVSAFAQAVGLSARERDVFELLLREKTNQEICESLSISLGTAKAHTHNIYQKADCESRAALLECFSRFTGGTGNSNM